MKFKHLFLPALGSFSFAYIILAFKTISMLEGVVLKRKMH